MCHYYYYYLVIKYSCIFINYLLITYFNLRDLLYEAMENRNVKE